MCLLAAAMCDHCTQVVVVVTVMTTQMLSMLCLVYDSIAVGTSYANTSFTKRLHNK
jgi:hypothetical protein